MSDTLNDIAQLSPKKRELFELLLKKKQPAASVDQEIPRREEYASAPLSFAQQRLWFLNELEGGSAAYNLPLATRLRGPLKVGVLERSFNEIVRRHEILRTRFTSSDGLPIQVVSSSLMIKVEVTDLAPLPDAESA